VNRGKRQLRNENYIFQFQSAGDDLTQERKVAGTGMSDFLDHTMRRSRFKRGGTYPLVFSLR